MHQLEHIKKVIEFGGIAYLIVRFTTLNKTYLLPGEVLLEFIKLSLNGCFILVFLF